MSHSAETPNYKLPLFAGADKYTLVGDINDLSNKVEAGLTEQNNKNVDNGNAITNLSTRMTTDEANITATATAATAAGTAAGAAVTTATAAKTAADAALPLEDAQADYLTKIGADALYARKSAATGDIALFIGDSYGEGYLSTTPATDRYPARVCAILGYTEANYCDGGSGIVATGVNHATNFNGAVERAYSDPSLDKTKVKLLVIAGGRNDGGFTGDWAGLTGTLVSNAKAKFPLARVVVFPTLWDYTCPTEKNMQISDGMYQGCIQNGVECFMGAWEWLYGLQGSVNSDGIHPTSAGYLAIAQYMAAAIKGGNYHVERTEAPGQAAAVTTANSATCRSRGGVTNLYFNCDIASGTGSQAVLFTLPGWAWPAQDMFVHCIYGGSTMGYALIGGRTGTNAGKVMTWGPSSIADFIGRCYIDPVSFPTAQ